ncbi:hypothetical protein Bca4012_043561 [Brassica carinata]
MFLVSSFLCDFKHQTRNESLSALFFFENLSTVMTSRRRILQSPASPVSSPSLTLILHNDNLCISNEDDL